MSCQFLSCKSLRLNSDVKCAARQVIEICIHNCDDSQIGQGTANDTTRNVEHFRCGLFWGNIVRRIFFQPTKSQICQNEHASMVGLQFIDLWHAPDEIFWSHNYVKNLPTDLFAEDFLPELFANELDEIQRIWTDELVVVPKFLNHSIWQ